MHIIIITYSHRTFGYRLTNPQPHGITHWIAYIACFYYNVYYNLLYVYYKCHHVTRPLSFITEIVVKIWMEYWLFFTSVWPVSNVWMNPGGWLHKNRTPYSLAKMCEMVVFHRWVMYYWGCQNLKNLKRLHKKSPPHPGNDLLHSTQVNERSLTKAS